TSGAYEFTQNAAFGHAPGADSASGLVSITLTDSDGSVASPTLTLTINDAGPTAVDDTGISVDQGTPMIIDVFANDTQGADGVDLVAGVSLATAPGKGTVVYNEDGTFTYTPDAGEEGEDSFTYTIVDSDGDESTATVTLTIEADSEPVVTLSTGSLVDEDGLPAGVGDAAPGDDVPVSAGTIAFNTGTVGLGSIALAASAGGLTTLDGSVVNFAWNPAGGAAGAGALLGYTGAIAPDDAGFDAGNLVVSVALDAYTPGATGEGSVGYSVTLHQPVAHPPVNDAGEPVAAWENNLGFEVTATVTNSDGVASASGPDSVFTVTIDDDMPVANPVGQILEVPVSDTAVGSLAAGWDNVVATSGSGSINASGDTDGVYLQWGGSNGSGYDFRYADEFTGSTEVPTDALFTLGTLTHNNFPISASSKVLDSVDLDVTFTLVIDGATTQVTTTIRLDHTETPNSGPNSNPANDDIVQISNASQVQTITVGGREFELRIRGFLDGDGNLVSTVRTPEGAATSFPLVAEIASTDDVPTLNGVLEPVWGADGPAIANAITWDTGSGTTSSGVIQGSHGSLTVSPDGSYSYSMSHAGRDAMEADAEVTETFTYYLTDADGDRVEASLDVVLQGVPNAPAGEIEIAPRQVPEPVLKPAVVSEEVVEQPAVDAPGEPVAGGLVLATPEDDVFVFTLDEQPESGATTIVGFGEGGTDSLDLRDLLQGEEADGVDLTSYLKVSYDGADTVIEVSNSGRFQDNPGDFAKIDQTITLEGVDLVSEHDDVASVIASMLKSGQLSIDQ
ncbi:choice-of-anchor K domain-containing protein, partial [Haliea sp.]